MLLLCVRVSQNGTKSCVVEQTVHLPVHSGNPWLKRQSWGRSTPRVPLHPARDLDSARVQEGRIAHLLTPVSYKLL